MGVGEWRVGVAGGISRLIKGEIDLFVRGSEAPFLGVGGAVGATAWGATLLLGWPAGVLLS